MIKNRPLTKTAQVLEALRQIIKDVGPDARLPGHRELMSSLGVSGTTLNAALSELEMQRAIYRRHGVGIFTAAAERVQCVALLCNPFYFQSKTRSPFWDLLLDEARERALQDNFVCEVHFCKSQSDKDLPFSDNLLDSLLRGHVHGVIGIAMNNATNQWLKERGIPYVSFGGPGSWYVGVDRASIIRQGVHALAEQNCRSLSLLSPLIPVRESLRGVWETQIELFRMALTYHNLPFASERIALGPDVGLENPRMTMLSYQEQGYHAVQQLFGMANSTNSPTTDRMRPDGLLFTDDVMAMGGIAALQEMGLKPGSDLQIATHSNRGSTVLSPYENVVTRLEVDPAEIVSCLFTTIRDLLENKRPATFSPSSSNEMHRLVQPILQLPNSSAS